MDFFLHSTKLEDMSRDSDSPGIANRNKGPEFQLRVLLFSD